MSQTDHLRPRSRARPGHGAAGRPGLGAPGSQRRAAKRCNKFGFTGTGDLIRSPELGRDLASAVGERNAALMVNHGVVSCGSDVVTGVMTAVLLERACRTNMRALSAGGPKTWSSDEESLAKRARCYGPQLLRPAWDYLVRRVDAGP